MRGAALLSPTPPPAPTHYMGPLAAGQIQVAAALEQRLDNRDNHSYLPTKRGNNKLDCCGETLLGSGLTDGIDGTVDDASGGRHCLQWQFRRGDTRETAGPVQASKELGESNHWHVCTSDRVWSRAGLHTSGVGRCRFDPGRGRSPLLDSLLSLDSAYHLVTTGSDTQHISSPPRYSLLVSRLGLVS